MLCFLRFHCLHLNLCFPIIINLTFFWDSFVYIILLRFINIDKQWKQLLLHFSNTSCVAPLSPSSLVMKLICRGMLAFACNACNSFPISLLYFWRYNWHHQVVFAKFNSYVLHPQIYQRTVWSFKKAKPGTYPKSN